MLKNMPSSKRNNLTYNSKSSKIMRVSRSFKTSKERDSQLIAN